MVAAQLNCGGTVVSGGLLNSRSSKWRFSCPNLIGFRGFLVRGREFGVGKCSVSLDRGKGVCNYPVVRRRKSVFSRFSNRENSDSDLQAHDAEETSGSKEEYVHCLDCTCLHLVLFIS